MISQNIYPLIAYIVGSIPFGLILANCFGNGQLRQRGSQNIGATNVFRTQGKLLGFFTFLLDFLKGFAICHFLRTGNEALGLMVVVAVVIGHMFPVWLKFKGGKGIATYFGVLGALDPYVFLGTVFIWASIFYKSRISSIAGVGSVVASCLIFAAMNQHWDFINRLCVLIGLAAIIVAKHTGNIKRLLRHEELSP
jgi:glycerol-3-phosphate acyltransferase PlsY